MARPAGLRLFIAFAVTSLSALAAAGACTVWDSATVDAGVAALPESGFDAADGAKPGSDAADGAPEAGPPPVTYLSIDDAARLCSLVFQCPVLDISIQYSAGLPIDNYNFSLCMSWLAGPLPASRPGVPEQRALLACMADGGTCLGAGACAVFEEIDPGDPRCAAPDAGPEAGPPPTLFCSTDGKQKIDCQNLYTYHCGSDLTPGSTCNIGSDGVPWCTIGGLDAGCVAVGGCTGPSEDFCGVDGLHFRLDCTARGTICTTNDEGGLIQCSPESCTTLGAQCNGNVLKMCDGAELSPFNCADLGGSCSGQNNEFICTRPGDTCSVNDPDVNVCSGSKIALCVGGRMVSYDCASVGKSCVAGAAPVTPHCG